MQLLLAGEWLLSLNPVLLARHVVDEGESAIERCPSV